MRGPARGPAPANGWQAGSPPYWPPPTAPPAAYNHPVGGRRIGQLLIALLAVAVLALLGGCSSSGFTVGTQLPWVDIGGMYVSDQEVGALGYINLELERFEDTEYFSAVMAGSKLGDETGSTGAATLGDLHLIINFDIGFASDYYYEGMVELAGEQVVSIDGQFVFPDQQETLPAMFSPT